MSINVKETHHVKPSQPTQHSSIILSNHDLVVPMVYIFSHHFFKNVDKKNDFMDPHKLRTSLEDILSDYYPLAGSLKNEPEGRLSIECTDRGIPFVVAESPDLTIKQFEEQDWQPSSILMEFIPSVPIVHGLVPLSTDVPLFVAQHTTLADGTVVLGTAMHHTITDGYGYFDFLENWGRKARQEPIIPPVHDRSLLKASGNAPTHEHHEFKVVTATSTYNSKNFIPPTLPPMITKLFYFSNDYLKKLHDAYSSENKFVSTNDVLVAHIWRLVTRARGISLDKQVNCGFACDGRERLKPSFPSNYFGNVTLNATPSMLVSDLINGPRSNVALQVRKAVEEMDDSKIRSTIDWIEKQPNKREIQINFQFYCGKDLILTNWSKFPLYALDFGDGTPLKFRMRSGLNLDGIASILGTKSNDGVEIYLGLIVEHMKKLEQDPEFNEFF